MTPRPPAGTPRDHTQDHGAVELLERALAYTRGVLVEIAPGDLHRPTPCAGWLLDDLLHHMDDALDAFVEAATGTVHLPHGVGVADPLPQRVHRLQRKACTVLGAWTARPSGDRSAPVRIGDAAAPPAVVAVAAALEITVHGWDVGATLDPRSPTSPPASLAAALIPAARTMVGSDPRNRAGLFAPPLPVAHPDPVAALLAQLGRDRSNPMGWVSAVRRTRRPPAS